MSNLQPATLIYNPSNKGAQEYSPADLAKLFRANGLKLTHHPTSHESEVEAAIPSDTDPVVAVGGDGTLRAVIRALLGKKNPLIIIPGGSANNIARALGFADWEIPELITRLKKPIRHAIDLGKVIFPWNESVLFVEGAGFGLFADGLATYDPKKGKSVARGLQTAVENLSQQSSYRANMTVDDLQINQEYKLVEILNTPAVGPRLAFSPQAKMTDGKFRVVLIDAKVPAGAALVALLARRLDTLEGIETLTGKHITLEWDGFRLHIDRYIYPDDATLQSLKEKPPKNRTIEIKIISKAINLWFPDASDEE